MGEPKLTEAQERALGEVGGMKVMWDARGDRFYSTEYPPAVRDDVVRRLVARKLVAVGNERLRGIPRYSVVLSDRGREVLADV